MKIEDANVKRGGKVLIPASPLFNLRDSRSEGAFRVIRWTPIRTIVSVSPPLICSGGNLYSEISPFPTCIIRFAPASGVFRLVKGENDLPVLEQFNFVL